MGGLVNKPRPHVIIYTGKHSWSALSQTKKTVGLYGVVLTTYVLEEKLFRMVVGTTHLWSNEVLMLA